MFKKIDKFVTMLDEKSVSFYKKILKNDNAFYILQIRLKVQFVFFLILFNLCYLSLFDSNLNDFILFNFKVILFLSSMLLLFFIVAFNEKDRKVTKLNDEQWEYFKDKNCYHLTSKECSEKINQGDFIHLKPTVYWLANIQVFFKKSVCLFNSMPDGNDVKYQMLKNKKDVIITIPIKNLDREKLRIRNNKNVLVYMNDYIGGGTIENFN